VFIGSGSWYICLHTTPPSPPHIRYTTRLVKVVHGRSLLYRTNVFTASMYHSLSAEYEVVGCCFGKSCVLISSREEYATEKLHNLPSPRSLYNDVTQKVVHGCSLLYRTNVFTASMYHSLSAEYEVVGCCFGKSCVLVNSREEYGTEERLWRERESGTWMQSFI